MSAPTTGRTVGDPVWVHAFSAWRRGVVTSAARTRIKVRYVSNNSTFAERERWFGAADAPVMDGTLPAPVSWPCTPCGYRLHGRPGQSAEQIRDGHNAQRHQPQADDAVSAGLVEPWDVAGYEPTDDTQDPINTAIERNIYVLDSLARADQRQPGIRVGAYHLLGPNDMRALESAGMLVLDNPGAGTMMALTDRGREFLAQSVPFDPGTGPTPGYVAGRCGHRVAESEWRAGFRVCERCPSEPDGGEV